MVSLFHRATINNSNYVNSLPSNYVNSLPSHYTNCNIMPILPEAPHGHICTKVGKAIHLAGSKLTLRQELTSTIATKSYHAV